MWVQWLLLRYHPQCSELVDGIDCGGVLAVVTLVGGGGEHIRCVRAA